ncbi:MAG: ATP-dependent RecD-like DNA helicase [Bacteroidota bacterium]|jgi:exodeoxyribonuclease V alpha subunit|nr:ATP-dependent RecD-like DNA helicase [Bacteroidota bacterium]
MGRPSPPHDRRGGAETQDEITLAVTLERVTWSAPDSAFVVCRIRVEGELFPLVAVGEMVSPSPGDQYTLVGRWDEHAKYGRQFQFSSYEVRYPVTPDGIERYLSSGLIPGLGKGTARKIVERFGTRTLEVMNTEIERLLEVDGIGRKKLEQIQREWERQRGVQNVMLFLKAHDISSSWAVRIYRAYGNDALRILHDDPYRLIEDIEGIGFVSADNIAHSLGITKSDERRVVAGIDYVLREAARRNGHTCVPETEFLRHAASVLEVESDEAHAALRLAVERGRVHLDDEHVYLPELLHAENSIARALRAALGEGGGTLDHLDLDMRLKDVEQERDIRFTAQQVEAIHKGLDGPVCVLTGGPGTGKTTTLIGILDLAVGMEWRTAICAPTGRAAKRIAEVTGHEARTIHRLLEFDPIAVAFQRDADRPVDADLIVVDEMSMVDVTLMAALLRARPAGCRLVLVGDTDQLPPVGPGTVLHDLLASGEIDSVALRLVLRQSEQSTIVTNAHRLREGFVPVFDARRTEDGGTFFREVGPDENIAQLIRDLVADRIPTEFGCDPMRDIQVLAPMYDTPAGVTHLNHVLQHAINGGARVVFQRGNRSFRQGDKVMQIRNDYSKDVYNGDIGFVRGYDEEETLLRVEFDGRPVEYAPEETEDLVLAYAVTVHKSQGGEYEIVLMPVVAAHRGMLRRTLLYTALTRARRMMVFLGQRTVLAAAVQNAREQPRYGLLAQRLREALR